jgi:hypothetical protein
MNELLYFAANAIGEPLLTAAGLSAGFMFLLYLTTTAFNFIFSSFRGE